MANSYNAKSYKMSIITFILVRMHALLPLVFVILQQATKLLDAVSILNLQSVIKMRFVIRVIFTLWLGIWL